MNSKTLSRSEIIRIFTEEREQCPRQSDDSIYLPDAIRNTVERIDREYPAQGKELLFELIDPIARQVDKSDQFTTDHIRQGELFPQNTWLVIDDNLRVKLPIARKTHFASTVHNHIKHRDEVLAASQVFLGFAQPFLDFWNPDKWLTYGEAIQAFFDFGDE